MGNSRLLPISERRVNPRRECIQIVFQPFAPGQKPVDAGMVSYYLLVLREQGFRFHFRSGAALAKSLEIGRGFVSVTTVQR